jgi:hypothetical protein
MLGTIKGMMIEFGTVKKALGGNTSPVGADSSKVASFYQQDLFTKCSCPFCSNVSTRTATDDN